MLSLRSAAANLSKIVRNISMQHNCQEIKIPTPGGFIRGKWWGPQDKRPILALHGWQDNCGSFDTLIPYLPPYIPVLAIDLPGHGHSYQLPTGIPYEVLHHPILIKILVQYFGWKKVSLMGHSMGAIFSYTYAFLFPEDVDFIICLDALYPYLYQGNLDRVPKIINKFIKYDAMNNNKHEPPSYTIDRMMLALHLGSGKSIAIETSKHILERNIAHSKQNPGMFYFKRDARLKAGLYNNHNPVDVIKSGLNVTFPIFIGKTEASPAFSNDSMFMDVYNNIKKSSTDCQLHQLPGTHHVHLNQPELVEEIIVQFLNKHYIEDISCGGIKPEMKDLGEDHSRINIEEIKAT